MYFLSRINPRLKLLSVRTSLTLALSGVIGPGADQYKSNNPEHTQIMKKNNLGTQLCEAVCVLFFFFFYTWLSVIACMGTYGCVILYHCDAYKPLLS